MGQKMSDFPVIHTERLTLRKPTYDDVRPLLELTQDEEAMLYYGMEPFKEEKQSRDEIDWFLKIWKEGTGTRWIITLKGEDDFIGEIGFFEYEKKHRRAEIGYKQSRKFWRKGYMTEALVGMLDYMYDNIDLNRVEALVDPRNEGSLRLIERQGFQRDGLLRSYEFERGAFVDLYMLSFLREDWENRA
jgi:ribosomal-protein-alanine N-acetyltransferase